MTLRRATLIVISVLFVLATPMLATAGDQTVVLTKADLKWKDMVNGIAAATVSGDMDKGKSRFFLKYPVGLVTPNHHHDADHYVTVVSGSITLTVNGKDYKLSPGAYFSLTHKVSHVARVDGTEEAVMFIAADGPWNVVAEK